VDQDAVVREVISWATDDPNIRLMVVTGSYAGGSMDELSDLDIELYVSDPAELLDNDGWYERFGRVLVTEHLENEAWHPTRLVYFVDAKIDFMIAPVSSVSTTTYDGPFVVLVDKDALGSQLTSVPGGPPREEAFRICIEWFFAAAIMCAKHLARGDLWPARFRAYELEVQLLEMIGWAHRARHGWAAPIGHNGSRIAAWADDDIVTALAAYTPGASLNPMRSALQASQGLFGRLALEVGNALGFDTSAVEPAGAEVDRLLALKGA
jgi:aminoglycoside 6-adenylyltransferase